jgi:hypothetical protein
MTEGDPYQHYQLVRWREQLRELCPTEEDLADE